MSYLSIEKEDRIALLRLDQPGEKVNKLNEELIEAFGEALDRLEQDDELIGAVIYSGKPDNFIAGADLDMLKAQEKPEDVEQISKTGNELLLRLARSKKPVAAAIHGAALGGGLEVALACHYRVASDHAKTKLGQPEVKLGLLPGGGGTQRLPRLIGIQKALTYMLTGKNIYPHKAKKIGLIDELTHQHAVLKAAKKAVQRMYKQGGRKPKDKRSLLEKLLEGNPLGRSIVFSQARKRAAKNTRGNYPAPPRIIDAVEHGYKNGLEAGLELESRYFGELAFTPESKALVELFFAMNAAKKNPGKDKVREVREIGVLGAGLMGSGITEVSVENDLRVILKDQNVEQAAKGKKTIWDNLSKQVKKHIISEFERDRISSLVHATGSYEGFDRVDLVIEAVFEDLELKKKIVQEVEPRLSDESIFASNTSSLPISKIAEASKHPERVVGMHYFSPVQKMPLMEVIQTDQTADWVTATAREVGTRQGKTVIVVNDGPGFYTTRILAPFMNEALMLLDEGADIRQLDRAMKDFGFPVGPVALLDEVGIDVGAHVTEVMSGLFKERGIEASDKASKLLEAGYKGRKNKKGFYAYDSGKKKEVNEEIYEFFGGQRRKQMDKEAIQQRMALAMVNEAAWCLQEEILRNPTDGNLGAILGLGFPPFLGGPFHYIDNEGAQVIVDRLRKWEDKLGNRFTPAPMLADYASSGQKFHPEG